MVLQYENDLKICQYAEYMLGGFTKHPPEKLEYWRKYRRENAMRCREQRVSGVKPTVNGSVYVQGDLIIVGSCVMDTVISNWYSQGFQTWIIR